MLKFRKNSNSLYIIYLKLANIFQFIIKFVRFDCVYFTRNYDDVIYIIFRHKMVDFIFKKILLLFIHVRPNSQFLKNT